MKVCKLYDDATNTGCRAPACTPQGYCISHRHLDTTQEPPCSEAEGNERVPMEDGTYEHAHDVMITLGDMCPWCGEEG